MNYPILGKPKRPPVWNNPHVCPIPEQMDYKIMLTRLYEYISEATETKGRLIDLCIKKHSTPELLQKNCNIMLTLKKLFMVHDIDEYSGYNYELVCKINSEFNSFVTLVNTHWYKLNIYY
jgi:hypothetical protein